MHAWEAIQKTLNHIEEHLSEEIRIEELAEIAVLSLFYYQRLFTRLVKTSVRDYIKLRRLAKSLTMLRNKENCIIDIAMEYTRFWLKKHNLIADGFFPEMYYKRTSGISYVELWIPFKKREK
jgi:methylphosphotriester-DNA--protein-cysteine methyltransferase